MSVASAPSPELPAGATESDAGAEADLGRRAASETCPLCGAPLAGEQEWCLTCGAAARTRVASAGAWRAPIALALVLALLCMGVLAAALVKLAHGAGPTPAPLTRVITTAPTGAPAAGGPGASGTP